MEQREKPSAANLACSDAQQAIDKICTHAGDINVLWQLAGSLEDAGRQASHSHSSACICVYPDATFREIGMSKAILSVYVPGRE